MSADRVADEPSRIALQRVEVRVREIAFVVIRHADDPWADTADVEAAKVRAEEAIGQADRIDAGAWAILQRVNVTAFGMARQDPATAEAVILGRIATAPDIF